MKTFMSSVKAQLIRSAAAGSLLAGFAFISPSVNAGDCLIEESSKGNVGTAKQNVSFTINKFSKITRVVSIDPEKKTNECTLLSYRFTDNIFTVVNDLTSPTFCRAKFTLEGIEAGCTPDVADDGEIAQTPLYLAQNITPNVMYVLDDSGSMMRELMPEEIRGGDVDYIYPRANSVYGSSDKANKVPTVDNTIFNARSRSNYINKTYYDPSTTYLTWKKPDGSDYPPASLSCALHNPETPSLLFNAALCRNLTTDNGNYNSVTWVDCKKDGSCTTTSAAKTYWPATYFYYKGGDPWAYSSYSKNEIKLPRLLYIGEGREARSDCAGAAVQTCTYQEEIQNFANWYTYYRSRVLTARAGSGLAFSEQSSGLRVGFGTINKGKEKVDGEDTKTIVNGVREFTGSNRAAFFSSLYGTAIPNSNTPLRRALYDVGEYYSRDDDKGPWSSSPGESGEIENSFGDEPSVDQLACRRNYALLMTDGYWNVDSASGDAKKNNDGTDGPSHSGAAGQSYAYKAVSPFTDAYDNTLADVAMYYWKSDLRDDYPNIVPATAKDPAFWQHMVTYGIGFGVTGRIDKDDAFNAIATGATINWPKPTDNEENKIDDLMHAGVNSRGGFFSASEPAVFANELADVLEAIAAENKSSSSAIAASSTKLDVSTVVYQASYSSIDWSGRIVANKVNADGSIGAVAWDTNNMVSTSPASRNLIIGLGAPSTVVKTALGFTGANYSLLPLYLQVALAAGGSAADALDRMAWMRGDKSKEGVTFRTRTGVLGDIINSSPFFVDKEADYGFSVLSGTEGEKYTAFLETKKAWPNTLFVGANDGMFHGFNAENGKELIAYIPVSAVPKLASMTRPDYVHSYSVDGSPRGSDAFLDGKWKTVVTGSTGAGGRSVFAIDVSSPESMDKDNFMWEFATGPLDINKLGVAMSEPVIVRLEAENRWVAIFGNGYVSGDNVKLFVVDLASGALLKAIDTGLSGDGNGLATPVPVDVDSDRITDYVYAGDLKGNLWKFDLTGSKISDWDVAFKEKGKPAPLFTAVGEEGDPQPITMRPTVGSHEESGYMIYFGTGKYFEINDGTVGSKPQIQSFYGIRDNDARIEDRDDLVAQSIIYEKVGTLSDASTTPFRVRVVSNESADKPPVYGWVLNLLSPGKKNDEGDGERAVSTPILRSGRIIFSSIIPSDNVCGSGGSSWLMELNAVNGGRFSAPTLDANDDKIIDDLDKVLIDGEYYPISGREVDEMIKTPAIITNGDVEYKYTSGTSGSLGVIAESSGDGTTTGRQSWRQFQ